jgi:hypothetical protein
MKYLVEYQGDYSALRASLEPLGARVAPTHPLRYAALVLDAQSVSEHYGQNPGEYLRGLAEQDWAQGKPAGN